MDTLNQILLLLGGMALVFWMYRTIKNKPNLFTKESFSKSFYTLALLGLGLIGFVYLLILLVRTS